MRLVFIDTETNDHPSKQSMLRIASITWIITQLDGFVEKLQNYLVKPDGFVISPNATRYHGITNEQARKYGQPINKILQELVIDLHAGCENTIIGHNVGFDIKVISEELSRNGIGFDISDLPFICTMQSTASFCKLKRPRGNGYKYPRLQELHLELFGHHFSDAHTSKADAEATYRCFFELRRRGMFQNVGLTHTATLSQTRKVTVSNLKNKPSISASNKVQKQIHSNSYGAHQTKNRKNEPLQPYVDESDEVRGYRMAAEKGDSWGQYNLGIIYESGQGIQQNDIEAIKWYRLATEQGHEKAFSKLRVMYKSGRGVSVNDIEAVRIYHLEAQKGNCWGQNNLGVMFIYGRGVKKNCEEAVKWFSLAAEQGYDWGQYNLGWSYYYGYGVQKNKNEGIKWFRLAAEQGNILGQITLGQIYILDYYKNLGYQNILDATKWFHLAAEKGNDFAQYRIGSMYRDGLGVKQDYREAVKWFYLAIDRGNAEALFELAKMYAKGQGVKQNDREAERLFNLAAAKGVLDAQKAIDKANGFGGFIKSLFGSKY